MICYKLTDKDGKTKGGMAWAVGVTNRATGEGTDLCTSGVLHVYRTALQAVFMAPVHVVGRTRLWEVEAEIVSDDGTKCGVKYATVLREIPLSEITTEQRVEIAIRCALKVYAEPGFSAWAEGWLNGKNRSATAADAAAEEAAWAAARAAAYAAAWAAADASAWTSADAAAWAAADASADAACAAEAGFDLCAIIDSVMDKEETR